MQVRKLLPRKEMTVDMKNLGLPHGSQVNGAVLSPGGDILNWVKGRTDNGDLSKPKAKRQRLFALESSSEEEATPAAPKKAQTGRRSRGKPGREKISKEGFEKVKGSNLKEMEEVRNDGQEDESKKQSIKVDKEKVEKSEEVAQARPGPKLTPEVAAKWRAVGATTGSKLQGASGGQKSVGGSIDGSKVPGVSGGQKAQGVKPGKTLSITDSSIISDHGPINVPSMSLSKTSVTSQSENLEATSATIVKREPVQLDYSQVGEEEVITLDDSEEEDNYELNYSQVVSNNSNLDDEVDDLLVDSPIPSPDLDNCTSPEQSDEDSDVEILEILNSSQTALFAKIYKSVHKVEPDVKIKMQVLEEEMESPESQSLLQEEEDEAEDDFEEMETNAEEPEAGLILRALQEVSGCDENMVRGAVRKVRTGEGRLNPDEEDCVVALVREEVEEAMVMRVARQVEGVAELKVKICLLELKERGEGEVTEAILLQTAKEQKEEEEIMKRLADNDPRLTEERVREAMKAIGADLLTMKILPEVKEQLKQTGKGDDKMITEAIEAERVDIEEKAMNLSKVFNMPLEVAKEKLEAAGLNVELASQDLLDAVKGDQVDATYAVDNENGLDDLDLEDIARSNSPELMEMEENDKDLPGKVDMAGNTSRDKSFDDSVDDLLGGMSDEDDSSASKTKANLGQPSSTSQQTPSLSSHLMSLITTTAPALISQTAPASMNRIPTQAEKDKASFKNQVVCFSFLRHRYFIFTFVSGCASADLSSKADRSTSNASAPILPQGLQLSKWWLSSCFPQPFQGGQGGEKESKVEGLGRGFKEGACSSFSGKGGGGGGASVESGLQQNQQDPGSSCCLEG